jgi:hypothetical protein
MVGTTEQRTGGKPFPPRRARVPLAVQAVLRQLRIDHESEEVQRRLVALDAKRGMFLPAELNALREAGWIDAPGAGAAANVKGSDCPDC